MPSRNPDRSGAVQRDDGKQNTRAPSIPEDDGYIIQGLSPVEIEVLAQKIYDLLRDEARIERERAGQLNGW